MIFPKNRTGYFPDPFASDKVLRIFGIYLLWVLASSTVILALFPYTMLSTVPVHFSESPVNALYIFAIAATMLVIYIAVYQSLLRQYRLQLLTRDRDILQVQISAMNKQAEAVLATEEKLKIMRHDVRHFSELISLS